MSRFYQLKKIFKAFALLLHLILLIHLLFTRPFPWTAQTWASASALALLTLITGVSLAGRTQGLLYLPLLGAFGILIWFNYYFTALTYLFFIHLAFIIIDFSLKLTIIQTLPLLLIYLASGRFTTVQSLTLLLAAAGTFILHRFLAGFTEEHKVLETELDRARWSASELPQVLVKIGDSIKKAQHQGHMNERIRVAREVHDTVGYTLTALISQIEVIREMMEDGPLKDRVVRLEDLSRKSLQNIRKEVDNLRSEEYIPGNISWEDRFRQLCDVFNECTGVRIDQNIDNGNHPFPDKIGSQVSRILQETLTNAYRHGKAGVIDVVMSYKETKKLYLIRVSDNGEGQSSVTPGNGLTGIQERVARLGGEMKYQTAKGKGFDIGIDIPYNGFQSEDNG